MPFDPKSEVQKEKARARAKRNYYENREENLIRLKKYYYENKNKN
jgi:hypothetical protein